MSNNKEENKKYLDKIRGCLIGGAAGDALGYPIEFFSWQKIREYFGSNGIEEYQIDKQTGRALISDDTQMTLFTAICSDRLENAEYGRNRNHSGNPPQSGKGYSYFSDICL